MINYTFEIVDLEGESIAVPVNGDATSLAGVLKLNSEGKEILKLLQENSVNQTIRILAKKYDNQYEELTEYVLSVVKELSNVGIIAE